MGFYRTQAEFLRSSATYRGFVGGIGSGKSRIGAYDLLRRAVRDRFYMVVSPSIPVLKDTSFPTFKELAELTGRDFRIRETDFRGWFATADGGRARIVFRGADDPESLRGPNLSGVWMDEASLMRRAAYDVAIGRLREGGQQGWLSATYTPKGTRHWTHAVFGKADGTDTQLFRAKTADNPFLPNGFVEKLRRQYSARLGAQELDGETLDDEGSLLSYEAILACQDAACLWPGGQPPPNSWPECYVGMDVGRSRDRSVIWTWEKVGDVLVTRDVHVMAGVPFHQQKAAAKARIRRGVVKFRIDKGYNPQLAEDLEREHPGVVEGVQLTVGRQAEIATAMENAVERRGVRIPDDPDIRADWQLVGRPHSKDGRLAIQTNRDETGHADRFWAAGLGYDGSLHSRAVTFARPVSARR